MKTPPERLIAVSLIGGGVMCLPDPKHLATLLGKSAAERSELLSRHWCSSAKIPPAIVMQAFALRQKLSGEVRRELDASVYRLTGARKIGRAEIVLALVKHAGVSPTEAKRMPVEDAAVLLATVKGPRKELAGLTPKQEALLDVLTDTPMQGRDVLGKLARQRIRMDAPELTRMCKKPALRDRGVRHTPGAGYYKVEI